MAPDDEKTTGSWTKEQERKLLFLRDAEGLTWREIGRMLGKPETTCFTHHLRLKEGHREPLPRGRPRRAPEVAARSAEAIATNALTKANAGHLKLLGRYFANRGGI